MSMPAPTVALYCLPPCSMAKLPLHSIQDSRSHQGTECVANDVAAIQNGGSEPKFVPFVPFGQEELCGNLARRAMASITEATLTSAPGKKAASTNPRKNLVRSAPTKLGAIIV